MKKTKLSNGLEIALNMDWINLIFFIDLNYINGLILRQIGNMKYWHMLYVKYWVLIKLSELRMEMKEVLTSMQGYHFQNNHIFFSIKVPIRIVGQCKKYSTKETSYGRCKFD